MPQSFRDKINNLIKENNYASASELFRDSIRAFEDQKLIESIMESEKDFATGKFKTLKSLKDLM
ncbi:MAG: hypothetical protein A3A96_02820 [Candidatus Zambryskibacteria bacterium RIFCSPLOWO2_01_FULL_39_39]|uniref:Ribbon-helix-helix protein CopG domain-containing protein n=1 Tax=Candidatus Zambryskibacteria bacterium RIFCSPLOWO2_01_FULL_39_39 TaxID=1802758 RepID=A0A1G2TY84_9BACT|nr:MAG: hypothetical protein UT00_C0002G0056 [Parcubacteria group bacterium GW2011_GWA1_38_7]OHA86901.1 MAG: hypothetical protein A2644_00280 [Candidatus Zambryskibacteria bacterium RIFCSPHIGHO2_01_FULL_39_63]OHA94466.1 MAG: hypothetical protein A3B88_02100 [Candidatus Zambryskibacteria bacterium RIFCSPHIGHO2_02_FULL_39_19]OHA98997.1 MAG: hypothetical protein A3F20_00425 [Candidatus Zambryskibacteria bacterium RIFCSPHIGHO2_12_FULL_39_21]OHB01580.1 MAG: hypothetical protein A3A96_02820 [Candidat